MRISSPKDFQPPGESLPAIGSGDDWLSRVNTTISNFRQLLDAAKQFKQLGAEANPPPDKEGAPAQPGLSKANVVKFLDLVIQKGYGNTTIGELLDQAKPLTLKQVQELIRRA